MTSWKRHLPILVATVTVVAVPAEAGFAFRKPLTINGAQVTGPAVDFPVLVAVEDPDLRSVANGGNVESDGGFDIAFRAEDGTTPLDWEIDWYNPTTGRLSAWVRFPGTLGPPDTRIAPGVNTLFYIYYGDPTIGCCQTSHGNVWDANYRYVLHLGEFTGNPVDATSNGVGTQVDPNGEGVVIFRGEMASPTGSTAWDLATDLHPPPWTPPATFQTNTDTYVSIADGTIPADQPYTIEAWFRLDVVNPNYVGIVAKGRETFPNDWMGLYVSDLANGSVLALGNRDSGDVFGTTSLVAGPWYYGAVTWTPGRRRVYLYDVREANDNAGGFTHTAISVPSRIGDDTNGNYIDGRVDEIRVSNVERSRSWIETTARNQACPSLSVPWACATIGLPITTPFLTPGAQEALTPVFTPSDCCAVATSTGGTTLTVQTSDLQMVWDTAEGAGLSEVYSEEEANVSTNRRGHDNYNVFATQTNDGSWHFERDGAGTLQVVESSPARVKLRQLYDYTGQLHLDRTWTASPYPRLAIEETLVFDVMISTRGAQGLHPKGETTCANQTAGNTFFCAGRADLANLLWLVADDDNPYGDMLALIESDPCAGRAAAGCVYEQQMEPGTPNTYYARVYEPGPRINTPAGSYTSRFLFYPRLEGLTSTGTEWQPYAQDHRNPDPISPVGGGSGWFDANERTSSPSDFYNEAEAAYLFEMNPAGGGLTFDVDGGTTTRIKPFFKIRNWRSMATAGPVTLEATNLLSGVDYTAAVKPLSRAYSCTDASCGTSTSRANGGLVGAGEFLADGSAPQNFALDFSGTNHLYLGSDSQFHGLNVVLATAGSGAGLDLQWEFWNGGSWADLEAVAGFNDQTASFTSNGTISWDTDPAAWAKRTLVAGDSLPLFWVRASLASGSYTTNAVEAEIRTDILLFQYCSDITADFQTFTFFAPPPTTVTLQALDAVGGRESVDISWRTASELNNLGFHLYRSLSPNGLWTRITSSIIPGLGSSPEGASYSYRDTGLQNGAIYYYKLEDIDSTSGSTFHGPVSATPSADASEDEDEGEPDEEREESPDPEGAPERTSYGSQGKPRLRVLSRSSRAMVVELTTPGFVARSTSTGVHVSVRGFDARRHPEAPALPLKRALLNGIVGRHARIVWAREKQVSSFPDLVPAAVGSPEVFVGSDGTVQPRRREMAFTSVNGVHPLSAARIAGDAFIRKKKKLALELSPLRYDAASRTLHLAKKLQVKIAFDRQAQAGEEGSGSEGVRPPSSTTRQAAPVLAYLHTLQEGLHAVPYEALGLQGPVPQKALRLSLQGHTVPHRVEPATKKRFGPGSVLYFYAAYEASSLDHSSETTYALEQGPGGLPMKTLPGSLKGLRPVSQAPLTEARFETNRFYQAGLLEAPDIWLWDFVVGGMSKSFPFVLPGLDFSATSPVQLQVVLQGASEAEIDGEHHLSVSVNGTPLGETTFDGKLAHVFTTTVPVSALMDGENSLEVTNLGNTGAYSFVFLDRFSVVHPRKRTLAKGRFEGVFSQKGRASLPGSVRHGVDVTDPEFPRWVKLRKAGARMAFKTQAGHHYVAASKGGLLSPRVSRPLETGLRESWNQADYVLIAPAEYLEAAQPLLQRREDQGLTTRAVSFEEIVSQFGYGRPSAAAIRDFLAHAYHHWEAPRLKYVLLLGDASYDPRNFTGLSKGSPLPALWARTSYLVTSSDPLIGAVNGEDGLADVAIGRLPALTVKEAEGLIRKVLDWEDGGQDLEGKAILVADNPDIAGDFEWDIADIRTTFLQGRETETIHLGDHGGNTRAEVLNALDGGASLLSYVGHGGPAVWASENVLNSWDPPKLLDQPEQPLMLTFNCLNGYFVAPNYDSLAEAFMKAEGRGTIGAFSPSGLSLDGPAHRFHRAVMEEIVNGSHQRLGDAILAAQAAYAETGVMPELLAVYHLLADPGMALAP